jgi:hypothetical protein
MSDTPKPDSRAGNTIVIAAAILAAVRLSKAEKLEFTPKVLSEIASCIATAKRIYEKTKLMFPEMF